MGECISDIDLERHRLMVERFGEAQRLQTRAMELMVAFKVWSEELHERYGLATDGSESISENGTILRAPVSR